MNKSLKLGMLVLLIIQLVVLVQPQPYFVNGPWIEDFYGNQITNIRSSSTIYCKWNQSNDTVSYNITWYNGSNYYPNPDTPAVIPPEATSEEEIWNCTVTLLNASNASTKGSAIVHIVYDPLVYLSNDGINYVETSNTYQILEDQIYYTKWNTTSVDFISSSITNDGGSLCLKTGNVNKGGMGTCSPLSSHLSNGLNTSYNRTVDFSYSYASGTQTNSIIFEILPVNDKPDFNITSVYSSVNETSPWDRTIEITDEEGNFPINFTVDFPPELECGYTNTSNSISLSCNTTNGDAQGESYNYTVNISITDNPPINSFNLTSKTNTTQLTVEVFRINHAPNITYFNYNFANQTEVLNMTFNSTDIFDHNNLSFSIESECNNGIVNNPWTGIIRTYMNSSAYNGSGVAYSYAIGEWNGILTNNHIICRDITLIVNDTYEAENNITISLNISNTNDPVTLHNFSQNTVGTTYNKYIYNLTAYELSEFKYQLNATDPDLNVIYNSALDAFQESLTFDSNSSWLNSFIDSNGLITIPAENLTTGANYSFIVTATDNGPTNTNSTQSMYLRVSPNTRPFFNQSGSNQLQFYCNETENFNYNYSCEINATQYIFEIDQNDTIVSINETSDMFNLTNGYLNMNIPQSFVGNHTFTISATDTKGAIGETNITITVYNTNNRPIIQTIDARNPPDNGLYYNQAENNLIPITVVDQDLNLTGNLTTDLNYNYEELTFYIENNNLSQTVEPFVSIRPNITSNSTTAVYLIVNTTKTVGTKLLPGIYSLNITVVDNYENYSGYDSVNNHTYTYNFQVYNSTSPPEIKAIYLYGLPTTFEWLNLSINITSSTTLNITENNSLTFNQTSWYDSTSGYQPTNHWLYDGEEINNSNKPNYNSSVQLYENGSSIKFTFGFFEDETQKNTTHILTYVIKDGFNPALNDSFAWNVIVNDKNRPIIYRNATPIANKTIVGSRNNENEDLWLYGNESGFYDPDYDYDGDGIIESGEGNYSISYNITDPTCQSYLTFTTSNENCTSNCELGGGIYTTYINLNNLSYVRSHGFHATAERNGSCYVNFTASDGLTSAVSGIIKYFNIETGGNEPETEIITQSGTSIRTVTETRTIPIPEEIEKPVYIDIIIPEMVTVYENNSIVIPLKITNTWNQPVYGVKLGYITNDTLNYTVKFERTSIYKIDPGEIIESDITITNYRVGGIYEILIVANVTDPEYQDFAKIYLNSLEQTTTGAEVRTLIRFAQDLLKKNKECQELSEILQDALELNNQGKANEAIERLEQMINGCKYLISESNRRVDPRISIRNFHIPITDKTFQYIIIALMILAITSVTGYLIWRKKINK